MIKSHLDKQVVYVELNSLKPHPKNSNKHSKEQIERLARILEYQGWRYPIKVSNLSGYVVSGHGRMEAAKLLGLKSVPVIHQNYDNADQEFADLTSDNAIASWAELDLALINQEVANLGPDFDIDLLGIMNFEIDVADRFDEDKEDEVPEAKESIVAPGDIWQLGKHRLMCGDSTDINAVERLMESKKADMVFTDPPYNVGYEGNNWSSGKIKTGRPDWEGGIKNDKLDPEKFYEFILSAYFGIDNTIKPGGSIYICYPSGRDGFEFIKQWENFDWHFQSTLIWLKSHLLISRWDYHPIYEPILYGWKEGAAHNFYGERNQSCVLEHKSAIRQKEAGFHPTQKPISLIEQCIRNSSKSGDLLFEPFGGSGSTMIACEKTSRVCNTMELDPKYCDVIIKRWENYTNQKATKLDTQEQSKGLDTVRSFVPGNQADAPMA